MPRIAILLALVLAACGQDVREVRLAEVDLSDASVVQELSGALEPADRSAFATYVAVHGRHADGTCGLPMIGPDGRLPETIGDAIRLVRSTSSNLT